jgi:protein 1.7|nr:MAG TPA: nucelotide kinase [Caudoviricetes sp.]
MDNKNERDEILELVEDMMKEFGLTETSLRNPINGQIEEADEIHKPNHYNWRGVECKDVIRQLLGSEGYKRYCEGNVIKYLYRYTHKGTPATDIAKAAEYLRMIAEEEAGGEEDE